MTEPRHSLTDDGFTIELTKDEAERLLGLARIKRCLGDHTNQEPNEQIYHICPGYKFHWVIQEMKKP